MPMIGVIPRALAGLVELEGAEHVAVVGDRQRRHLQPRRLVEQLADPGRSVEHRELGVDVQVHERDELDIGGGLLSTHGLAAP